jgi:RimJ/RimL family protein N-acetyltransferase
LESHEQNLEPNSAEEEFQLYPLPNWSGYDFPLVCRELKKTDSKVLYPVMKANAPHLKGYIGWAKYAPSWDFKAFQQFVNDHVDDEWPRFHLIFSIGKKVVGFGSLAPMYSPRDIQVALWVAKEFEGQGVGKWIVTQLEWYSFYFYGYDNVYYQHDASDRRSGKLPSILGYKFDHAFDVEITAQKETGLWYSWKKKKPAGIPPGLIDAGNLENWEGIRFPWVSLI